MSKFKAGDRVVRGSGVEGVVIGPDQRPDHRDRWIVWTPKDEAASPFGEWTSQGAECLTLIPDTVSVTVELPRDEAEALAEHSAQDDALRRLLISARPGSAAVCRFRLAIREALR